MQDTRELTLQGPYSARKGGTNSPIVRRLDNMILSELIESERGRRKGQKGGTKWRCDDGHLQGAMST
jgi:hypothetical protein